MPNSFNNASACSKDSDNEKEKIKDVYLCVFFDGTGNNCFEQKHKQEKLKKKAKVAAQLLNAGAMAATKKGGHTYSKTPTLLSINPLESVTDAIDKAAEKNRYGLTDYQKQEEQATVRIPLEYGQQKYSNVARLRAMVSEPPKDATKRFRSFYIEGAGRTWTSGSDVEGLGMGTSSTGVVDLVSKAMILVNEYLASALPLDKSDIALHFAIFGFSRGSACGRLFAFMLSKMASSLPKLKEFTEYLPKSYFKSGGIKFLEGYRSKDVDFMGIYDTVASIGFLHKDDNDTNHGLSYHFKRIKDKTPGSGEARKGAVNVLHAAFLLSDAHNNFHRDNVYNYGLYSPQLPHVKHTFHICAMDEYRENFALTDLGAHLKDLKGNCTEVLMPGCHSDIGGGYVDEDPEERMTLRTRINKKVTRMIANEDPTHPIPSAPISLETLRELGWMSPMDETRYHKDFSQRIKIVRQDKIEFEPQRAEGYSNISLKMMKKRAMGKFGLEGVWPDEYLPFQERGTLPARYAIPDGLKGIDVTTKCDEFAEGERHVIITNAPNYKYLRQHYIHFTCTDELNVEKWHLKQSGANLGNPPYWLKKDDYYLLCRLVYHGDPSDHGLHTMEEY